MYHYKVTDTELPPADQELAHWDAHRARTLSERYGWIVVNGPDGWYAKRGGDGTRVQVIPDQPSISDRVLESHLAAAEFRELLASLPSVLARSA